MTDPTAPDLWRLHLRPAGMFSNVNEVVEQLRLAEIGRYRFVIDWSASCYRDEGRPSDPWTYYFEPCFEGLPAATPDLPVLPGGVPVACTRANVITPRLDDGNCNPLLMPRDRYAAHRLIAAHLRLRPDVAAGIEDFARAFRPRMIGLHIRGPGRSDGGVPDLRRTHGDDNQVPMDLFFSQVDEALRLLPEAGIFACSDSSVVIDDIRARFGERILTWPAIRSEFGEMHANHSANTGLSFPPYQLGLDVLSEAYLLARTDIFVHGNSNVANFALCAAPTMLHAYVPA